MSIFKNFIEHKTKELTVNIQNGWTQLFSRTKHTKRFYKNPSYYNENLLNNQANEVYYPKEKNIAKMSAILDNPNTTPKSYLAIILEQKKNTSHNIYSCWWQTGISF